MSQVSFSIECKHKTYFIEVKITFGVTVSGVNRFCKCYQIKDLCSYFSTTVEYQQTGTHKSTHVVTSNTPQKGQEGPPPSPGLMTYSLSSGF